MIPGFQEKLRKEDVRYPYRKPTQVSGMSILRRVSEISLRNSANWPRIFGRRGALFGGSQKRGPTDCLAKTQLSAKSQDDV